MIADGDGSTGWQSGGANSSTKKRKESECSDTEDGSLSICKYHAVFSPLYKHNASTENLLEALLSYLGA